MTRKGGGRDSGEQTSPSEAEAGSSSLKAVASTRPAAANPAASELVRILVMHAHAGNYRKANGCDTGKKALEAVRELELRLRKLGEPEITRRTTAAIMSDVRRTEKGAARPRR